MLKERALLSLPALPEWQLIKTSVADAIREFVAEHVWERTPVNESESEDRTGQSRHCWLRRTSQLDLGLAFIRYILRVPPISTTTPEEIAS